ncbi:uncharacterized protein LOC144691743 [Cetorhinus maximus]
MTCVDKVVMFKICLLLFANQTLARSQQTEILESLNATIGENVLFSINSRSVVNRSVEWKYSDGSSQASIIMFAFSIRDLNIFPSYKHRVQVYDNGSFLLSNVELNDTGCYTVTLVDASGKEVMIKKRLTVIEAERQETLGINNGVNCSESIGIKNWNIIGISTGVAVVGMCAICAVVVYFIRRRKQEDTEDVIQDLKSNENLNSNAPMVVYLTYVGTFPNYGKSCQTNPLDQT